MATAYFRLSGWWGEVEAYRTDEELYTSTERKPLGATAETPHTGARRCQMVFSRSPTGSTEDVATCSIDFLNLTAGAPDDTWTSGDFASLETLIDSFWSGISGYMMSFQTLTQYRWYRVGPGIVPPNPPVRITTKAIAGTYGSATAPQVAISVTERTPVRRCWGRFYIPSPGRNTIDTSTGRIVGSIQTAIADTAHTLYSAAAAADFLPVVYAKTRKKLFSVEKLQVDDLADVIRSRRWDRPLVRQVRP